MTILVLFLAYAILPSAALGHRRYLYPNRILSEGTRHILSAMRTYGVSRLVCRASPASETVPDVWVCTTRCLLFR
jgi:nucleoside-diphosphate-sugar epimerase